MTIMDGGPVVFRRRIPALRVANMIGQAQCGFSGVAPTGAGQSAAIEYRLVDTKHRTGDIMGAMAEGRVGPLFDAMAEDVTWRWMGVNQWSRTFTGKQLIVDALFGGARETLNPSSSVEVHGIHADGEFVVVEHSGRNELADGRRYDNNYCWIFRFENGLIKEVREYMDTQLVTETFGPDEDS